MQVTLQEVLRQLDIDEPDYTALAALGPDAVPHLTTLIRGEDPGIASKAAYLASLIHSDESVDALSLAVASPHDTVRVAAAAALRNLPPPQAARLADRLLDDADVGVRKLAVTAAGRLGLTTLEGKVRSMASTDDDQALRQIAREELKQIGVTAEGTGAATRKRPGARGPRTAAKKAKKKRASSKRR